MSQPAPEKMLENFNGKLRRFGKSLIFLNANSLEGKIKNTLRKMIVAEYFHNNYIVAITGLQGVGKTTLLKQLYGIGEDWLPENIGRGEKKPVLIREYDGNKIQAKIKKLGDKNNYEEIEEVIDRPDNFHKIIRSDSSDIVFAILEVPFKIFNTNDKMFVLLPGFEKEGRDNRSWQNLMRHTLVSSATCIFVCDETRLADKYNEDILSEVKDSIFSGGKPIIAITRADNNSDEKNNDLSKLVKNKFSIPEKESDRVINTGVYSGDLQHKNDEWQRRFKDALCNYSSTQRAMRIAQLEDLDTILKEDVVDIIKSAKSITLSEEVSHDSDITGMKNILETFDESAADYKKNFLGMFKEKLDEVNNKAIENIRDKLKNKWFDEKVIDFFRSDLRRDSDIEKLVMASGWGGFNKDDCLNEVVYTLNARDFKIFNYKPEVKGNLAGNIDTSDKQEIAIPGRKIRENIIALYDPEKPISQDTDALNKFEATVRLIPTLAMETISIKYEPDKERPYFLPEMPPKDLPANPVESTHVANTIKAISIVLGVDGAVDGEIDTIPALLKAIGLPVIVAPHITAFIGVAGLAAYINSQMNKNLNNDFRLASVFSNAVRDGLYANIEKYFDNYMDFVRKYLNQRLSEKFKVSEKSARFFGFQHSLAEIKSAKDELRGLIYDYRESLEQPV